MRITLKNFRCYIDQTFDFGKGGIVLLSGQVVKEEQYSFRYIFCVIWFWIKSNIIW